MQFRPYEPADKTACLSIFDSNLSPYFDPSEREDFAQFLDAPLGSYFVVIEPNNTLIASGGFVFSTQAPVAVLTWGMVVRSRHRQGAGSFLVQQRLQLVAHNTQIEAVEIHTSQHTVPFYERMGFVIKHITNDGFGPGLHKYAMRLSRHQLDSYVNG